jgi:hypothetical protein
VVNGNPGLVLRCYFNATQYALIRPGRPGAGLFLSNGVSKSSLAVINGFPAVSYYSNGILYYQRALDATGDSWSSIAWIEQSSSYYENFHTVSLENVCSEGTCYPAVVYFWSGLRYARASDPNGSTWEDHLWLDQRDTGGRRRWYGRRQTRNAYYDASNNLLAFMRVEIQGGRFNPSHRQGAAWPSMATVRAPALSY